MEETRANPISLDAVDLVDACKTVRSNIRVQTLLLGLSRDDSDTLVELAVSMYIKARVRRH